MKHQQKNEYPELVARLSHPFPYLDEAGPDPSGKAAFIG